MLNKESNQKEEIRIDANVGEHIGYEVGAKMIKDYHDKHNDNGYQFIGRNIIEQMITQPGCIGLNIFKGLNESGEKTYVLTGVKENGQPLLEVTAVNKQGEIHFKEGIVADRNVQVKGWYEDLF